LKEDKKKKRVFWGLRRRTRRTRMNEPIRLVYGFLVDVVFVLEN
jgi:hypothetical protein